MVYNLAIPFFLRKAEMPKNRLEAISDGIIAIVITIMVLEISAPLVSDFSGLKEMLPGIASYLISFMIIANYWNNHHQIFLLIEKVHGRIIWLNFLFMFMISLFPVFTDWLAKTSFAQLPTLVYIVLMFLSTNSFILLQQDIVHSIEDKRTHMFLRVGLREWLTLAIEVIAFILALVTDIRWLPIVCIGVIGPLWIIPDLRIKNYLSWKKGN